MASLNKHVIQFIKDFPSRFSGKIEYVSFYCFELGGDAVAGGVGKGAAAGKAELYIGS